jgi:uncharacterized protein YndB with AHSA1/START domain
MPDILHDFPVSAPPARVFAAIATPAGLDAWWTLGCEGAPSVGATWRMNFGPGYRWTAAVRAFAADREIEWELVEADDDWRGTRVAIALAPSGEPGNDATQVRFRHTGWRAANDHYRTSSFCWAMYLRLMKRFVETGERTPYAERLDV